MTKKMIRLSRNVAVGCEPVIVTDDLNPSSPISIPSGGVYTCVDADAGFKIDHSFDLDGVNETFQGTLTTSLGSTSTGTFSLGFKPKNITSGGSAKYAFLFRNTTTLARLEVRFLSGKFQLILVSGGLQRWAKTTVGTFPDDLHVNMLIDHNGVEVGLTINEVPIGLTNLSAPQDLTKWIDGVAPNILSVGSFLGSSNFAQMGFQYLSYFTDVLTPAQKVDFNNRNRPKNPVTEFGANTLLFYNADNSGSTAQFTITDDVESLTILSENLEDIDKTTDTTY